MFRLSEKLRNLNASLEFNDYPICGETSAEFDARIQETAAKVRYLQDWFDYLQALQNSVDYLKDDNVTQNYAQLCLDAGMKLGALGGKPDYLYDDFRALEKFIAEKAAWLCDLN